MSDTIQERLLAIARQRAEDRVVAEFGPAGGNPNAVPQDHIEWEAAEEIDRLNKRVEELESRQPTEEQIDAAWELLVEKAGLFGWDSGWAQILLFVFARLGIVACEECGGSGVEEFKDNCYHTGIKVDATRDCPTCHRNGKSHGWVWRNDD